MTLSLSIPDMKGKTIAQILPRLDLGGVEQETIDTATAIISAGGRAIVISGGGRMVATLTRAGAEHITIPAGSKNPLRWTLIRRHIAEALKSHSVDLVHIRSRAPAWIAMKVARQLNIPVLTTIHGRYQAKNMAKKIYNGIMVKADRVIAISEYTAKIIQDQFPAAANKITVIHRGVDLEVFDPKTVSNQRVINVADNLGIPDHVPVIMLPARPTPGKGMEIMIDALAMINDVPVMMFLVGAAGRNAKFQQKLSTRIERHDLGGKVRLTPSCSDMPAAMLLADVVVMPSVMPEPFGRVAIEAQAMGRPVVAFDHGGTSEIIVHGKTGWLAVPKDVKSLAYMVREALNMSLATRKSMAAEAREHIRQNFSAHKMVASTLAIYDQMIRAGR